MDARTGNKLAPVQDNLKESYALVKELIDHP